MVCSATDSPIVAVSRFRGGGSPCEHLVTDVGGLGLALTGYLVHAASHFAFHVTHFAGFSLREALGVGTGLGIEVVLAVLLLSVAWLGRPRSAEPAQ